MTTATRRPFAPAYIAAHAAAIDAGIALMEAADACRAAHDAYAIARAACTDANRALSDAIASARRKKRQDTWDAAWAKVDELRPPYDAAAAESSRLRDIAESSDRARRAAIDAARAARDAMRDAAAAYYAGIPEIAELMAAETAAMADYGRAALADNTQSCRHYRRNAADAARKLADAKKWADAAIGLGIDTGIDAAIDAAYGY